MENRKSCQTMVSNYCGISLLDVLSQILERQVYNEIFSIICPHLTHWQHCFLPGKSTVSQLSQVHQLILYERPLHLLYTSWHSPDTRPLTQLIQVILPFCRRRHPAQDLSENTLSHQQRGVTMFPLKLR